LIFIVRGLALGLSVQPLTVAGLSEISSRQLPQASSLNTVARAVSSSLGIAVLATLVQTQVRIHYGHLAEQITPASPIGRLLPEFEALFISHGYSLSAARSTALQFISLLVQQHAFMFAIQDAFDFSLVMVFLAMIAVLFVRSSRKKAQPTAPTTEGDSAPSETEEETTHGSFAMVE
jgi:hypothetical protein